MRESPSNIPGLSLGGQGERMAGMFVLCRYGLQRFPRHITVATVRSSMPGCSEDGGAGSTSWKLEARSRWVVIWPPLPAPQLEIVGVRGRNAQ